MSFELREATLDDVPQLIRLRRLAIRELAFGAYTADQIDAFLLHVPTPERVVADGTYFVAVASGMIVGSGGWSMRGRASEFAVDSCHAAPTAEAAASIRAMYTHPNWVRRGIGRSILMAAEADAQTAGFHRFSSHALLPSVPLYRACGYAEVRQCSARLDDRISLPVVHMEKRIHLSAGSTSASHTSAPPDRDDCAVH
jgi:GNAT superfamily N-acetyltransferase